MSPGAPREPGRPQESQEPLETIPVLRPLLPHADRLLPFLRRIDATRTYTNWGPLACELERRLSDHFGLLEGCVVSASSGTAAMVGAILATAGRATMARPFALVPAFTFAATAIAVEQCGYRPYLLDVDAENWMLDADRLEGHPLLDQTGLVVPVSAFGRPVPQNPWVAFRGRTGIPVVVDGAASLERLSDEPHRLIGDVPVSLSFHATKAFATGEGGAVVTADPRRSSLVTEALNFGFFANRESRTASTNGKMSEYHAAVGLAEFEGWPSKRLAFQAVADRYRRRLDSVGLGSRCVAAPTTAGCYVLFQCRDAREAERVRENLTMGRIEFRLWYALGLHTHPHFHDLSRDNLDVTEHLAPLLIGVPVAVDLSEGAIDRVALALRRGVNER